MLPARNSSPTRMFGPRPPAAAELVGAVLQERAGELHRPDALVAEPLAAVLQVLAVVLLGDRQQPAGRALDRVAHRVVAEDVAKAGLLLDDRAGERDRQPHAPGLTDHDRLEAPAVGADGARDRVAARGLLAVAVGSIGLLVGEVMAQPLRVRRPVGLCTRELLRRALLGGSDDQPEGAHVARRLQAEHPAHAPEGARGVLAPLAVDLQALVRPRAVRCALRLDCRSAT